MDEQEDRLSGTKRRATATGDEGDGRQERSPQRGRTNQKMRREEGSQDDLSKAQSRPADSVPSPSQNEGMLPDQSPSTSGQATSPGARTSTMQKLNGSSAQDPDPFGSSRADHTEINRTQVIDTSGQSQLTALLPNEMGGDGSSSRDEARLNDSQLHASGVCTQAQPDFVFDHGPSIVPGHPATNELTSGSDNSLTLPAEPSRPSDVLDPTVVMPSCTPTIDTSHIEVQVPRRPVKPKMSGKSRTHWIDAAAITSNFGERPSRRVASIPRDGASTSSAPLMSRQASSTGSETREPSRAVSDRIGTDDLPKRKRPDLHENKRSASTSAKSGLTVKNSNGHAPRSNDGPAQASNKRKRSSALKQRGKASGDETSTDELSEPESSEAEARDLKGKGRADSASIGKGSGPPARSQKITSLTTYKQRPSKKHLRPDVPTSSKASGASIASSGKQPKPSASVSVPLILEDDDNDDDDDDALPSLPGASSFTALGSQQWDIYQLDDAVFLSLPGKLHSATQQEMPGSSQSGLLNVSLDIPRFWWPAKILSRNRQAFRLELLQDPHKREIGQFSPMQVVIPPDGLRQEIIVNRLNESSGHLEYPTPEAALVEFDSHPVSEEYTHPSTSSLKNVLRIARKSSGSDDDDGVLPDYNSPHRKPLKPQDFAKASSPLKPLVSDEIDEEAYLEAKRAMAGPVSSQQTLVDESDGDSSELDEDIKVGSTGLGLASAVKNEWWPARVIAVRPMSEVKHTLSRSNSGGNLKRKQQRTTKNGPYEVEFYPKHTAKLWREHFLLSDDADFRHVPLGKLQEVSRNEPLTNEEIREVAPALNLLMQGQYKPASLRHELFFKSKSERKSLPGLIHYGEFPEEQIKQLTETLSAWLDGRPIPTNGAATQDAEAFPDPMLPAEYRNMSDEDKITYLSSVLVPTALEVLVINDDEEILPKAIAEANNAATIRDRPRQSTSSSASSSSTSSHTRIRIGNVGGGGGEEEDFPKLYEQTEQIQVRAHELAAETLKQATPWYQQVYTWREHQESQLAVEKQLKFKFPPSLGPTGRSGKKVNYKE